VDNITKEIKDNSTKSKALVNINSIIGSLATDTINEHNNSNDEKAKMKSFQKEFAHD